MNFLVQFCEDFNESVLKKYTKHVSMEIPLGNSGIILTVIESDVSFFVNSYPFFSYMRDCNFESAYLCYDYLGGDELSYCPAAKKIHLDILSYNETYSRNEEDCTIYNKDKKAIMLRDWSEFSLNLPKFKEEELFQLSTVTELMDKEIMDNSINLYNTFENINCKNKKYGVSFNIDDCMYELTKPSILKLLKGFL